MRFKDRSEAGRLLAQKLMHYKDRSPVVLGLPRGGVPVAFEVAQALHAPLDVVLVRKIGAPWQPELAVASVAEGDPPVLARNQELIAELSLPEEFLIEERDRQLAEIARRRKAYLAGRPAAAVEAHAAIVVDDGIATGATTRAALESVRRRKPAALVLAVPVGPPDTLNALRREVDEVVTLAEPELFFAIGSFYRDFRQLEDADVINLLAAAAGSSLGHKGR